MTDSADAQPVDAQPVETVTMTVEELQQVVSAAVEAKVEAIRATVEGEVERQLTKERGEMLAKAADTGERLFTDPGTDFQYALVNLDLIDFNPVSRRTQADLDPNNPDLDPLKEEILHRGGLFRPLLVYRRKGESEGRYMLVKGARRLAALRALGEELTHCYILPAKPPLGQEERWVNGY